jgi:hypothetical protein
MLQLLDDSIAKATAYECGFCADQRAPSLLVVTLLLLLALLATTVTTLPLLLQLLISLLLCIVDSSPSNDLQQAS